MSSTRTLAAIAALLAAWAAGPAGAQPQTGPRPDGGPTPADRGGVSPGPPVAPEVIARDAEGRVTVRATRLTSRIAVDGRLDEPVYGEVRAFGGFIQQEPREGQPATVRTDVWLLFDDEHIYVAARCWQDASLPMVANDLRRDGPNMFENDNFAVIFDTFRDRRSGFMFQTNPLGAINDQLMTDDGAVSNRDWNTVWDLHTSRDDEGWSVEMAIPFRSLRFAPGREQIWGVNFRRNLQARAEYAYLTRIPASVGRRGLGRVSLAATLVGLEAPAAARLLDVKPYILGGVMTDLEADPVRRGDGDVRAGVDVKMGLGRWFTADITAYTDFAQVEEDEAQVNLTRYSLFQPEKREFFLEGLGLFAFGGVPNGRQGGAGGGPPVAPVLFFSRRIGLSDGVPVQLLAGGRVTGRLGPWSLGGLQVRQEASAAAGLPRTDFSVLRVRRDLGRRSSVGMIYTRRSPSEHGPGTSQAGGVDLLFAPTQELTVNAYVATSSAPGAGRDDASYRVRFDYNADLYGLQVERLVVGDDFAPEVGLMRREDFQRSAAEVRVSWRPAGGWVRKWSAVGGLEYDTDNDHRLESRLQSGRLRAELRNGDEADATVERSFEALSEALELAEGHVVPIGAYGFTRLRATYRLATRHPVSGEVAGAVGSFFGGSMQELSYRGRLDTARLTLEPLLSLNRLDLPHEPSPFWVNVLGLRATWPFSPRASLAALVQHRADGGSLGTSVRFRWEYRPGSDLFVVYSEGRNTLRPAAPMVNRGIALKITRLLRF